jgi:hypothetical protein
MSIARGFRPPRVGHLGAPTGLPCSLRAMRNSSSGRQLGSVGRGPVAKLGCALLLIGGSLVFEFQGAAAWNAFLCGYAIFTAAVAAMAAEAEWEPQANLAVGVWTTAAPFTLGFANDTPAIFVHLVAGSLAVLLSALAILESERGPPSRFQPGAAGRPLFYGLNGEHAQAEARIQGSARRPSCRERPMPHRLGRGTWRGGRAVRAVHSIDKGSGALASAGARSQPSKHIGGRS